MPLDCQKRMQERNQTFIHPLLCVTLLALNCAASSLPAATIFNLSEEIRGDENTTQRGYSEQVAPYPSERRFRLLRRGDSSAMQPDAIASVGGGMLISVLFFGLCCILGFITCQVVKSINCNNCWRRDRHRIDHSSSIKPSSEAGSRSAELQQLSYDDDLRQPSLTPTGNQIGLRGLKNNSKALLSEADNSNSQHQLLPPRTANAHTHHSSPSSSYQQAKQFGKSKGNAVAPVSLEDAFQNDYICSKEQIELPEGGSAVQLQLSAVQQWQAIPPPTVNSADKEIQQKLLHASNQLH